MRWDRMIGDDRYRCLTSAHEGHDLQSHSQRDCISTPHSHTPHHKTQFNFSPALHPFLEGQIHIQYSTTLTFEEGDEGTSNAEGQATDPGAVRPFRPYRTSMNHGELKYQINKEEKNDNMHTTNNGNTNPSSHPVGYHHAGTRHTLNPIFSCMYLIHTSDLPFPLLVLDGVPHLCSLTLYSRRQMRF